MKSVKNLSGTAGLLAMIALAAPSQAKAQHSGVEIWAASCGRCHTIQPPGRYSAKDWTSIMSHMTLAARLTDAQRDAVLTFLRQGARDAGSAPQAGRAVPIAQPQPAGILRTVSWVQAVDTTTAKETYAGSCAPCHGTEGKGDGPAAVAFNPRPPDFTNAELWADRSDEELVASVANGIRLMPAFGEQLSREQLDELVRYVKSLRGKHPAHARRTAR